LFGSLNYLPRGTNSSNKGIRETRESRIANINKLGQAEKAWRQNQENEIRAIILGSNGRDSLFETISLSLFLAQAQESSQANELGLKAVFENSLYFLFRLLFWAYFEATSQSELQEIIKASQLSLAKIGKNLKPDPHSFKAWPKLQKLFDLASGQNPVYPRPLILGGLFDSAKAPLLNLPKVFSDETLDRVLRNLFQPTTDHKRYRDFSLLAPAFLGDIYESLLGFELRLPSLDKNELNSQAPLKDPPAPSPAQSRLVKSQRLKKAQGVYYTPSALAYPLVSEGLAIQLQGPGQNRSLLKLRVLDCSCGGGQLLLVALNVLTRAALERLAADKLASQSLARAILDLKAQGQNSPIEPPDTLNEFRLFKRLILKETIYGVDCAPVAVELTKAALSLETFVFGAPDWELGEHIKPGDSLVGATWADLKAPRLLGQDPNEPDLFDLSREDWRSLDSQNLNYHFNCLNYLDILKAQKTKTLPRLFELLKAAQDNPSQESQDWASQVERARRAYGFFNWPLEFSQVFAEDNENDPGFHLIIGNPPWEKTKFEEPQFFVQYHAAYRGLSNSQKKAVADQLLKNPAIKAQYQEAKGRTELMNQYLSARYPLSQGIGDNNLFRYFVEKALSLLAYSGSLSYIIPLAFLTDDGSRKLRRHLLENYRLRSFDGFENKNWIFGDVHERFKFGLAQIEKVPDPHQVALVRFLLTDPQSLKTKTGSFPYALADVKATSPKSWAYMETLGGLKDLQILKKLYAKFPSLDPGWLDFRRELDATFDKKLFREERKPSYLPLYKGEMIWHFETQAQPPQYWLDPHELKARLRATGLYWLKNDLLAQFARESGAPLTPKPNWPQAQAFFGLKKDKYLKDLVVLERGYPRLAFRAIASDTNERTLISALTPRDIGAQNSLWLSMAGHYAWDPGQKKVVFRETPLAKLLFAQAIFNSLTVDWALRAMVAMNVNKTYVYRLPLPQPSALELSQNPQYQRLILDSAALSLYKTPKLAKDLAEFAQNREFKPIANDNNFIERQAELDMEVARLYGLSKKDLTIILAGFPVLSRKKPFYQELILAKAAKILDP
jgi:hypothetical protein